MLKALRWSDGPNPVTLRDVSTDKAEPRMADVLTIRPEKQTYSVEDALREMEQALAVKRELRASTHRLLAKLPSTETTST